MKFAPVPFAASNLTNGELARFVRANYSGLQGPLAMMLNRFELGYREDQPPAVPVQPVNCTCPHCGSPYDLDDEGK